VVVGEENIDVKGLAEVYDASSSSTFISLYMNDFDKKFIEKRSNACKSVLRGDTQLYKNFEKTMSMIFDYLNKNDKHEIVIFASYENKFFRAYNVYLPIENMLIVDSSPYIKPLVEVINRYNRYGLILINSHKAKMYVVFAGRIENEEDISKAIMGRHKKGGWSQARFQRIRKGAINQFINEAVKDTEKFFSEEKVDKIIIAGPGEAKTWFAERLPPRIRSEVIDVIDENFNEMKPKIISDANRITEKDEKEEKEDIMETLKADILGNGLSVYGIEETMDAVKNGKVSILLVAEGMEIAGWKCERCQVVGIGTRKQCPYCGHDTADVDVIEELVELAEKNDSRIEFFDNDTLKEIGGVAALLRYK